MEVALGGGDEPVACDFLEDVRTDAGVGHPGQAGVAQVVAAQVFVVEVPGDVVPVGGVAQDCGADATAARAGVEAGVRVVSRRLEPPDDEWAQWFDDRDQAGDPTLGVLVDQAAGSGGGLSAAGQEPLVGIDVAGPDSGDLADPRGSAGAVDDDITPSAIAVV